MPFKQSNKDVWVNVSSHNTVNPSAEKRNMQQDILLCGLYGMIVWMIGSMSECDNQIWRSDEVPCFKKGPRHSAEICWM